LIVTLTLIQAGYNMRS